tara:strand:- start:383 stop:763 length:381 start_codon:yes stop_codon:yes gene_type:complete
LRELILDSSILIELASKPVPNFNDIPDYLGNVEMVLLDASVNELSKLRKKSKTKMIKAIDLALRFSSNLKIINTLVNNENVDDLILDFANKRGSAVATQDRILRMRLRKSGISVISLRRGRIMFEG